MERTEERAPKTTTPPTLEAATSRRLDGLTEAVRGLSAALEADRASTESDLRRALGLVREAGQSLAESFNSLSNATNRQSQGHTKLMARMSASDQNAGGLDLRGFLDSIGSVVARFGDLVGAYALETMRINDQVSEVLSDMEAMQEMVQEIDTIADDTNILAINAALEAARAGPAGKGFQVVSSEIRDLARKTKHLDSAIHGRVEGTNQTSQQVRAALQRLVEKDLSPLVAASDHIKEMTRRLEDLEEDVNRALSRSETFAQTVRESASDAMRALQFEDIVTQILDATMTRQSRLPQLLQESLASLPADPSAEDVVVALRRVVNPDALHMPAPQETLDEGEVALF